MIAAVLMPHGFRFDGYCVGFPVRDSKRLSPRQRNLLFGLIERQSVRIDVEELSVQEINERGINWANTEGFRRLIERIDADQYIVDGRWRLDHLGKRSSRVSCVVHADEFIPPVLAAGIVAKVKRDLIMRRLHALHPEYAWDSNTGHGTQEHLSALRQYGPCEYHRTQFVMTALKGKGVDRTTAAGL